jgi:cytochrome b6-f complex iron-sulfur subunit
MTSYHLAPLERPGALTGETLKTLRSSSEGGISRRSLLRGLLGGAVATWLMEVTAGTLGFAWPNLAGGFGGRLTIGDIDAAVANPATTAPGGAFKDGAPAYFPAARSFIVLLDPDRGFVPGSSPHGDGAATNVRTLYQRCTHLGCKPNFCTRNYWFECPCHGSRYDRLGIKVANLGPAPRGLDRFASDVDANGVLTIDTGKITLGPLPVALGQPGVIPPRSPTGCL